MVKVGYIFFPDTRPAQVMEMFGSLPEEVAVLRKASARVQRLRNSLRPLRSQKPMTKAEREKTIVEMYNENYSIDDIWRVSGFSSRSSVFRILWQIRRLPQPWPLQRTAGAEKSERRNKG